MSGIKIATVTESISNFSISGVTVKDTDEIPEEAHKRILPILFPSPDEFVTGLAVESQAFHPNATSKVDVNYTLNYVFLYVPVGSGRYITKNITKLIDKVVLILNKFIDNDFPDGAETLNVRLSNIGVIQDTTGAQFFGAHFAVDIKEFYEV